LNLFAGTSYVNIPTNLTDGIHRRNYVMQNAGFSYRLGQGFVVGAQAGVSNRGGLLRTDVSYSSYRFSGYATAIMAAQTFPLNQLQSLFSGTSSVKGAVTYRTTARLSQGFFFEHTNISPGLIYRVPGSTDYLSPNFSYRISFPRVAQLRIYLQPQYRRLQPLTTTGSRYDVALNSQLTARMDKQCQVTIGSVQDPLQISSEDQFSVRDSISIPIKEPSALLGIEHDRVQPSLVSKLNQELGLLSPLCRPNFSPTLQRSWIPAISARGQGDPGSRATDGYYFFSASSISVGTRLHVSPNFSVTIPAMFQSEAWTQVLDILSTTS